MNKIQLDLPQSVCRALAENLAGFEISNSQIPQRSVKKIRIGVVLDKILNDFDSSFELGSIQFNLKNQTASRESKTIKLTEKEVALIDYLRVQYGFISRQEILQHVWQYSQDTDTRTVESHVHRLNQKFEDEFGLKLVVYKENTYKLV